jgi:hypothetical protein
MKGKNGIEEEEKNDNIVLDENTWRTDHSRNFFVLSSADHFLAASVSTQLAVAFFFFLFPAFAGEEANQECSRS